MSEHVPALDWRMANKIVLTIHVYRESDHFRAGFHADTPTEEWDRAVNRDRTATAAVEKPLAEITRMASRRVGTPGRKPKGYEAACYLTGKTPN
jgi:hypothetical protein